MLTLFLKWTVLSRIVPRHYFLIVNFSASADVEYFTQQLTCGAMTKTVIKVNRIKLIHTKERKNTKKEPIPAPKYPGEKYGNVQLIQNTSYRKEVCVEGGRGGLKKKQCKMESSTLFVKLSHQQNALNLYVILIALWFSQGARERCHDYFG